MSSPDISVNPRAAFLEKVLDAVTRGEQTYGAPEFCFDAIAVVWSAYLEKELDARDVAVMMVMFKAIRDRRRPVVNDDNLIDMAGYAVCAARADANRP